MAAKATLSAQPREGSGKGVARKLRAAGRVPAVVYGHGDTPQGISVDAHELELLMAGQGVNAIVTLALEGAGDQDVILRDVQKHPSRPQVTHVDFFHVNAREVLHVKVPVRLTGQPRGVAEDGGVLDQVLYDLEVECLPGNIPDAIVIDVTALRLGESVRVGEVPAENVKILHDADLPIASVVGTGAGESGAAAAAAE